MIVAEKNARLNSVESRIQFLLRDVFDQTETLFGKRFDILVSNPPYVAKDEWEQLQAEVRDYEPPSAVTDGMDGYKFYHRLAKIIPDILKPGSGVVLEAGFNQAESIVRILKNAGLDRLQITHDLQGIPRVVSGTWMGPRDTYISLN